MAINQNHTFEDLDSVKCSIVEKNVNPDRVLFLKELLEYNGYKLMIVPSPVVKAAPRPVVAGVEEKVPEPSVPETFTIGVTDLTFNPINAIYGRLLHTPDGHVVTQAYWQQKESVSHDEIPYYQWNR